MVSAETLCHRCESELEVGDLRCPVCATGRPADYELPDVAQAQVLRCTDCNAVMKYDVAHQAATCPFCGARLELERPTDPIEEAQEFVPFAVDRAQAQAAIRAWLTRKPFFAPGDLPTLARVDRAQPVLWAAWVVSGHSQVHLTADEQGKGAKAQWGPTVRTFERPLQGLVVPATRGLGIEEIASLATYQLASVQASPPERVVLEDFGVTRSAGRAAISRGVWQDAVATAVGNSSKRLRNAKAEVLLSKLRTRRVLLPAWIAAYRYRDTLYRVVVHGQTPRSVVGKTPVSWLRVLAAIGVGFALLALVVLLATRR